MSSRRALWRRLADGCLMALLTLLPIAGCGSSEPPAAPTPATADAPAIPPEQVRRVLQGLRSDQPRVQYAALESLARVPSVLATYRQHVERLQRESRDSRVRQKAAEVLATLEAGN